MPPALIERPKRGFRVPLAAWLRGPLRPWAEDLLDETNLRQDGLLEPALVTRAWHAFQRGRGGPQEALWGVLMLQAWHAALRADAGTRTAAHRSGGSPRPAARRERARILGAGRGDGRAGQGGLSGGAVGHADRARAARRAGGRRALRVALAVTAPVMLLGNLALRSALVSDVAGEHDVRR